MRFARWSAATATRHWQLTGLLAFGLLIRLAATLAYRPALEFQDSFRYLFFAARSRPDTIRPFGYSLLLRVLSPTGTLLVVPVLQHLLVLAGAVALYALMVRHGTRRWLAAVGVTPLLLDAYQVDLEQFVLSDVAFEMLVLAALVVLFWRRRPGPVAAGAAALLLAGAALTRQVGLPLLALLAAYLVLRRAWRPLVAAVTVGVVPLVLYAWWFSVASGTGRFALTADNTAFFYGRFASIADCPRDVRPHVDRGLTGLLRGYQSAVYTPGSLLLVALLGAAGAGGTLLRRRRSGQLRWMALTFGVFGLALVVVPSLSGFDYRHGVPMLALVPPAGAVAAELAARSGRPGRWRQPW